MSISDYNYLLGFYLIIVVLLIILLLVIGMSIKTNTEKIIEYLENKPTKKIKDTNSLLIQKLLKDNNLDVCISFVNSGDNITIDVNKKFRITSPEEFDWNITVTSNRKGVIFKEVHPNIDETNMSTILNRVYQLSIKYAIPISY